MGNLCRGAHNIVGKKDKKDKDNPLIKKKFRKPDIKQEEE